jgi:hypothetical protein
MVILREDLADDHNFAINCSVIVYRKTPSCIVTF